MNAKPPAIIEQNVISENTITITPDTNPSATEYLDLADSYDNVVYGNTITFPKPTAPPAHTGIAHKIRCWLERHF